MEFGQVVALLILIVPPMIFLGYIARRFFALKERQLEANTHLAAEKAAQYATDNATLESRVRVLEQIVTDGGYDTAAKIEALREPLQARLVGDVKMEPSRG